MRRALIVLCALCLSAPLRETFAATDLGELALASDVTTAVRYVSQPLSDAQKSQARTNIGATLSNPQGYGAWSVSGSGPYEEQIYIVLTSGGAWEPRYYDNDAETWISCGDPIYSPNAASVEWLENYYGGTDAAQSYIGDFSASRSTNWEGSTSWIADPPQMYRQDLSEMGDPPDSPQWVEDMWGNPGYNCWVVNTTECNDYGDGYFWNYSPQELSTDPDATSLSVTFTVYDTNWEVVRSDTITWRRQVFKGTVYAGDSSRTLALQTDLEALASRLSQVSQSATNYTDASISATSPAFSNAVLSVGLGIDTNTVAALNELVDSAHDLPVTGATSVGALLLALAAAVAALKKNLRYALGTAITASAQLADRVSNPVTQNGASDIVLTFPAAISGKLRDFLVYVIKGANATGAVTFTLPTGASIRGNSLTQTIAAGEEWLFGITEIGANVFLVKAEKLEVPT